MKKMKKMIAILLAAVLVLGMNLTVFANEPAAQNTSGSISITNAVPGKVYKAYLMFELESYSTASGAYLYTVKDPLWRAFVETNSVASQYLEIYEVNHVRIKDSDATDNKYTAKTLTAEDKAALATAAIIYAKENNMAAAAELPRTLADGTKSYTQSDLTLGYYAVDSSMGALCGLTTLDPNSQVAEKNTEPTVDKEVMEDVDNDGQIGASDTWGERNDDEIGDTVYFRSTIHAKAGAHNYVLHDRMGDGLTLNKDSIEVKIDKTVLKGYLVDGTKNRPLEDEKYEEEYDYYVLYDQKNQTTETEVCDFEVHFTTRFLNTITEETDIVVSYNALLNEHAYIYENANRNATQLEYGDGNFTTEDITLTYTYMIDVIKTDADDKVLSGAKFELYAADSKGTGTTLDVKDEEGNDVKVGEKLKFISLGTGAYTVAASDDTRGVDYVIAGDIVIRGLDVGTYYLVEKDAPAGYNKLENAITVKITRNANGLGNNNIGYTSNGVYDAETGGGYQVINKTGGILPSTGGVGTTLFYIAGGALVVAAAVVMVTRKRMDAEE